jgi:Ni,Fe-hydrogenase III component G
VKSTAGWWLISQTDRAYTAGHFAIIYVIIMDSGEKYKIEVEE